MDEKAKQEETMYQKFESQVELRFDGVAKRESLKVTE